jgi:asparagine synthase (glutamine-hydrolysing)
MSFLAVFNSDGVPIDGKTIRAQHEETARNVKLLGPSRQTALMWSAPDTNLETKDARHLVELDGRLWLLGRVRLDRRGELCMGLIASETEPDALLCLRAFARWGERCVEHLRGDFCFVLWDEMRQRLFCARDHLGVRPLFYGRVGDSWFVSDSLDAVTCNSGLTGDLDDFWVVDFLTKAYCLDFDRTVYKHIKRLAPAHTLVVSRDDGIVKRYWTLELDEPIIYRCPSQYFDHFHEVLARAIEDRLPKGRIGIAMSGGLDSTTLAAKAVEVAGDASRVVAYTRYFARLIPDDEPHFSALVAKRLKIAHTLRAADDAYELQLGDLDIRTQEPGGPSADTTIRRAVDAEMASQAKVWFYGEGPDNALTFEWQSYLRWLINRRDWMRLAGAVAQHIHGKEAREWLMTLRKLNPHQREAEAISQAGFPQWIDKDLVERLDLAARTYGPADVSRQTQSWRPRAMLSFTKAIWQRYFEEFDPVVSGTSLDCRHPFLDLDVLTFMLRTPPIPWARRKRLIRDAMRGVLPEEVLTRDKAPLVADPQTTVVRKTLFPPLSIDAALRKFIDPAKLYDRLQVQSGIDPFARIRALDAWLKSHTRK